MQLVSGGVCAAKGFSANGVCCGILPGKTRRDLALVVSEVPAAAAGVYTTGVDRGAPVIVTSRNLADGRAQAILCNSGNANVGTPDAGEVAEEMCRLVEKYTGIPAGDVAVASTGIIGQPLEVAKIAGGMGELTNGLKREGGAAAEAIMTLDTMKKECAVRFSLGDTVCTLGAMAKGSAMVHPNMATVLCFITTDVAISPEMLRHALRSDVASSFNMVSVDGSTGPNDMMVVLANGEAGNEEITQDGLAFARFLEALNTVTIHLCRMIAGDGEGATKLLECTVEGATAEAQARTVARGVISSPMVKLAIFRSEIEAEQILSALDATHCGVDRDLVDVDLQSENGSLPICRAGRAVPPDPDMAGQVFMEKELDLHIRLHQGNAAATAWGCDLTYDYIRAS